MDLDAFSLNFQMVVKTQRVSFPQKNHQARDDTIYKHLHPVMVSVCQRFSNINCRDRKQKHAKHSAKHYKPKRPNWRKTQPAWSTNGFITYTAMGAKSSHVTYWIQNAAVWSPKGWIGLNVLLCQTASNQNQTAVLFCTSSCLSLALCAKTEVQFFCPLQ